MKKNLFRLVSLTLVLLMLLGCFASCSKKEEEPSGVSTDGGSASETGGEADQFNPGDINFGGYDYKMLVESNTYRYCLHVYEGEGMPSAVTDLALWKREATMKENYGVNLVMNNRGTEAPTIAKTAILGGEQIADVLMLRGHKTMEMAIEGLYFNVNELPHLNLKAEYWDQRIQQEYLIGDKLLCIDGDYTFAGSLATHVVIYNDTMYNDLGYYTKYGTPFELVSEGKWTIDMMYEMMANTSADLNGDQVMDENDSWGYIGERGMPYAFLLGSGKKALSTNNGSLTLNMQNDSEWETMLNIIAKMVNVGQSDDCIVADRDIKGDNVWGVATDMFKLDRALFRSTSLTAVMDLVDMKSDYGILPIPKYNEDQDGYYCMMSAGLHYPMSFPITMGDVNKGAQISEILCYTSRYGGDSLYNAFFDLMAYARLCRTENDVDMLKLVFANKVYDLDTALIVTNLIYVLRDAMGLWSDANSVNGKVVTKYTAAYKSTVKTKMQDIVTQIETNTQPVPS